LVPPRVK